MFLHDLQSESAFYGRKLDIIGHLYLRPAELPAKYPDILFFCLYTTRLLVDKKLPLGAALEIQKQLSLGQQWEKVVRWDEDRPFSLPARNIEYKGYARSAFSSTLMFKDRLHFRFGYMGFGFFSNGRRFDQCAKATVYGHLETIYKQLAQDPQGLAYFWQAVVALGALELGKEANKGNYQQVARELYLKITGDNFPTLFKK